MDIGKLYFFPGERLTLLIFLYPPERSFGQCARKIDQESNWLNQEFIIYAMSRCGLTQFENR
jgi:hypothetical protein